MGIIDNSALRLHERMGFRIVGEGAEDSGWLMVAGIALTRRNQQSGSADTGATMSP